MFKTILKIFINLLNKLYDKQMFKILIHHYETKF
jgi:hypothetical protein